MSSTERTLPPILTRSTTLENTIYFAPDGLEIQGDNVTLDGNGATIIGLNRAGVGIKIREVSSVSIRNLKLRDFEHGIRAEGCSDLRLENLDITSTLEVPANTIFLDIFRASAEAYGGAVLLQNCERARVEQCDFSHQFAGLQLYDCQEIEVRDTLANYSSGFGFYLNNTTHSQFSNNYADFCSRWHAAEGGVGHMGADAAGFVIVNHSSHNRFVGNFARMGGDGFFLAGLRHDGNFAPCNHNHFEGNDASYSPNIAFEATFSAHNVFIENKANRCNYGFWLGFSRDGRLIGNQIASNRTAGVATENGIGFEVRDNVFTANAYGLLLWSKRIPKFDEAVPDNDTTRDWHIHDNEFTANSRAIRIAADQDHGLRAYSPDGVCPPPRNHRLENNRFDQNRTRVDIEDAPSAMESNQES